MKGAARHGNETLSLFFPDQSQVMAKAKKPQQEAEDDIDQRAHVSATHFDPAWNRICVFESFWIQLHVELG